LNSQAMQSAELRFAWYVDSGRAACTKNRGPPRHSSADGC